MDRREVFKILEKQNGTVLDFPIRGSWGSKNYRGNCSGFVHAWLIYTYNIRYLAEMYAGGGTGYDVAKDFEIKYIGADLNPNPVRDGIVVCNALTDDIPYEFTQADFVFQHMPYPEIGIRYAGTMYDADENLIKQDIGQMPFKLGMCANNKVTMKLYAAMQPGAKMGILCGNVRRNGMYHDMMLNLALPGEIIQNIVKVQHNCMSDGRKYTNNNFVPITHENLIILQKPFNTAVLINYTLPQTISVDIRDSRSATWRDVIYAVMHDLKKPQIHYKEVYESVKDHKKAENNNHPLEKIRQVLRSYPTLFNACGNGYYSLAA